MQKHNLGSSFSRQELLGPPYTDITWDQVE